MQWNWDGAHLLNNLGPVLSSIPLVLLVPTGSALICCVMGRGPEKLEEIKDREQWMRKLRHKEYEIIFLCLVGYQGIYCKTALLHPPEL